MYSRYFYYFSSKRHCLHMNNGSQDLSTLYVLTLQPPAFKAIPAHCTTNIPSTQDILMMLYCQHILSVQYSKLLRCLNRLTSMREGADLTVGNKSTVSFPGQGDHRSESSHQVSGLKASGGFPHCTTQTIYCTGCK